MWSIKKISWVNKKLLLCLFWVCMTASHGLYAEDSQSQFSDLFRYAEAELTGILDKKLYDALENKTVSLYPANCFTFFEKNEAGILPTNYQVPVSADGTFRVRLSLLSESLCRVNIGNGHTAWIFLKPARKYTLRVTADDMRLFSGDGRLLAAQADMQEVEKLLDMWHVTTYLPLLNKGPRCPEKIEDWGAYLSATEKSFSDRVDSLRPSPENARWAKCENKAHMLFYLTRFYRDYQPQYETDAGLLKDFFRTLRFYALDDPAYARTSFLGLALLRILNLPELHLPEPGDTPVSVWKTQAQACLAEYVGFPDGWFYDMLALTSYYKQITVDCRPLSKVQEQHIAAAFSGNNVAAFLQKANADLLAVLQEKGKYTLHEQPHVAPESVLDSILSVYKGRAVVVDFWATWCGPCLRSMAESRPVRERLPKEDVAYVYLTNHSSPQDRFEEYIQTIPGEHYRLEDEAWKYITRKFAFNVIPFYLFYDRNGHLRHKVQGQIPPEQYERMIRECLEPCPDCP